MALRRGLAGLMVALLLAFAARAEEKKADPRELTMDSIVFSQTLAPGEPPMTVTLGELLRIFHAPGLSLAVIDDEKIAWARERAKSFDQAAGGDRDDAFAQDLFGRQSGVAARAVTDANIDIGRREVDQLDIRRDPGLELRMRLAESRQARQQPLRRKRRGGGYRDHVTLAIGLAQHAGAFHQAVEAFAERGHGGVCDVGGHDITAAPQEQWLADPIFDGADMLGHSAGCHAQFLGGPRKAFEPHARFQSAQGRHGWRGITVRQLVRHGESRCRVTRPGPVPSGAEAAQQ